VLVVFFFGGDLTGVLWLEATTAGGRWFFVRLLASTLAALAAGLGAALAAVHLFPRPLDSAISSAVAWASNI
jgi:hypothetical protein